MSLATRLQALIAAILVPINDLRRIKKTRITLSTTSIGGINTTADFDIGTLTIPANRLVVGDVIFFEAYQSIAKANGGGSNFETWFKVNGVKQGTNTLVTPKAAVTNIHTSFCGFITVAAIGTTGVLVYGLKSQYDTLVAGLSNNNTHQVSVNTTQAITLTVGANFSSAKAANAIYSLGGMVGLL